MPKSTKDGSIRVNISDESTTSLMGLKKYCREYVLRSEQKPRHELKAEIDAYLAEYDNKVEEEKQKMKDVEGIPDEDGWVTVSRNKGVPRSSQHQQSMKSKKKKELLNFYTHQKKETKNKQIQELQERLKMEKEKINQMRQMRKFKPY